MSTCCALAVAFPNQNSRHSTLLPSIPNKSKHNAPSPRLSDTTKRSRACRASPTHALSSPVSRQTPTTSMSQWIPPFPNAGNLPISIEAAKKATSPRPSTPNPKPQTQNPKPKTPSPKPKTPNLKLQTSDKPQTLTRKSPDSRRGSKESLGWGLLLGTTLCWCGLRMKDRCVDHDGAHDTAGEATRMY